MIRFPGATTVGRILPKEEFYKRLTISVELKEKFISDIRRITVENSLTEHTLRLKPGTEVVEIIVLAFDLKKKEVDNRILEIVARQNPHNILFWLRFEEQGQFSIYINKLYKTQWQPLEAMQLESIGFTLDDVWNGYIEQIALLKKPDPSVSDAPVAHRLKRQEELLKLEKNIEKLENAARAEKQPKKKFELAMQVQQLKRELNEL